MAMTQEEKKNRVVTRAIKREREFYEKHKRLFREDIERAIEDRDQRLKDLQEDYCDYNTNNEEREKLLKSRRFHEDLRRLNLAEMRVYRLKQRFFEIYHIEYWVY